MLPTTILVDEALRRVVRPNDVKDLNRFIRNGKTFLLAENSAGKFTHRNVVTDAARPYREDCRPGCASNRRASRANRKSPAGPQPPQRTSSSTPFIHSNHASRSSSPILKPICRWRSRGWPFSAE